MSGLFILKLPSTIGFSEKAFWIFKFVKNELFLFKTYPCKFLILIWLFIIEILPDKNFIGDFSFDSRILISQLRFSYSILLKFPLYFALSEIYGRYCWFFSRFLIIKLGLNLGILIIALALSPLIFAKIDIKELLIKDFISTSIFLPSILILPFVFFSSKFW